VIDSDVLYYHVRVLAYVSAGVILPAEAPTNRRPDPFRFAFARRAPDLRDFVVFTADFKTPASFFAKIFKDGQDSSPYF